ncbi:MAG: methylenetetrahydrofolate reductase [NAD(P)H] [Candidatus Baltobacteraceae bacterium]
MRIDESLATRRPHFSFEFFPPKSDAGVAALFETIGTLRELQPGFVSVTYGAGGSSRARTIEVAKRVKAELDIEVLAHLTCVGSSVEQIRDVLDELVGAGIENVLALRGDPPRGQARFEAAEGGFAFASDLIAQLVAEYPVCIGAAAYPETHPEAQSPQADIENALRKVRAGARFLVTQFFFDNDAYFAFVERARAIGIDVPIVPGIMPITNYEQIGPMTAMIGARIPARLLAELESRLGEAEAVAEFGVAYAALQCADLLARGAPGIHFYTLNKSPATRAVVSALGAARGSATPR